MTTGGFRLLLTIAALTAAAPSASWADEQPEVRLAPGAASVTLAGQVTRGDRDIYPVLVERGRRLSIEVSGAAGAEAVFQVYPPGVTYSRNPWDVWIFRGRAMRGADRDTRNWSLRAPSTGQYLVVVGPVHARADYELTIRIE